MAENITSLELNGIKYALGKSIYAELDLSLERFVELLGRDFYCPTLNSAPTSTTKTYQDTDESVNTFQIGQPCRWKESDGTYRLAVLADMTSSSATWYKLPVKVSELTNDAGYLTSHQDISHLATKTELNKKQDTISDLATIRANAEKGATALQSVPSEYVTETELSGKGYATTSALNSGLSGKVDKDGNKVLSTNDFTNALKSKLEGLSNYDDTTISNAVNKLRTDFDTLVSGDTTTAIKTFNEVIAFLDGITDTQDLESIIASIEQQIDTKQDKISDLETIRQGAAKGATALQSYTEKYTGTYSKPSGGIPKSDLASAVQTSLGKADTALQTHQDISGKADKSSLAAVATSGSYNDLTGKPTVDTSLSTSSTNAVQNKAVAVGINAKYTKPSTGIPKSDLASDVQTSLGKADTALQSYTEKYTGTYSKPSTGIPKTDLASAVQTSLGKADTALQSFTETDPVFSASAAAGIKSSDISNWNSKTSNTGTITGIKMNGASKGTSGVVDLGTVITSHQDISGKLDATTAASTYLSKTDAASTYLGKTAKAASATTADSATKATQDGSGNVITSTYATKADLSNVAVSAPKFQNLSASTWVADTTYSDFPYKCTLSCNGVTGNDYAEVVFDVEQASSGTYAPVCETGDNTVTIWSSINTAITIPVIIITK